MDTSKSKAVYIGALVLPSDLEAQFKNKPVRISAKFKHPVYHTVGDDYIIIGRINEEDQLPIMFNNTAYFDMIDNHGAQFLKMEIVDPKFPIVIDSNDLKL